MPPRYAYWTILIDQKPTAFRARDQEELLPTLNQLRRKSTDVVMKWFARGRLWDNPEQAQWAHRNLDRPREPRGRDWRPGGEHKDPRDRFKRRRPEVRAFSRPPVAPKSDQPAVPVPPSPAAVRPPAARPPAGRPPAAHSPGARPPAPPREAAPSSGGRDRGRAPGARPGRWSPRGAGTGPRNGARTRTGPPKKDRR